MMNLQAPLHSRCLLMVLLLGAQWGGVSFAADQATLSKRVTLAEHSSPLSQFQNEANISAGNDFAPPPALLRFSGKAPIGCEDTLIHFQKAVSGASCSLDLPFDPRSGLKDTALVDSTALTRQSLLLQHTRLQI